MLTVSSFGCVYDRVYLYHVLRSVGSPGSVFSSDRVYLYHVLRSVGSPGSVFSSDRVYLCLSSGRWAPPARCSALTVCICTCPQVGGLPRLGVQL